MARLRFIAPGHDHQVCQAFGQEFPHGVWVEDPQIAAEHLAILVANPTFEADPGPAAPASRRPDSAAAKEG